MRLLLAANNQATRRRKHKKLPSISFNWVQAATDMHPACPNKKQNHLQNSLLRRTQFWVRRSFSKPASLKRASLVNDMLAKFNLQRSSVEINRNRYGTKSIWSSYGMPQNTTSAEGVQVQRGSWRSNTPNGQGIATPLTSQPSRQPLCTVSGQTTTRASPPSERSPDAKGPGVGTNVMRKQGCLYSWETPRRSTCPLPKGWRSNANRYRLGSSAAGGARSGWPAIPVRAEDQTSPREQEIASDLERMLRTIQGDAAKQEATSSKERPYSTEDMDDNQFQ